ALKGLGLNTEKDLTTSDMSSNFKYYFLKSKDVIKTKFYTLKVTDAMMASQVFIKLEDAGISNSSIERVEYSALNALKNKMRAKAIMDAKEKAVIMTAPINQIIGSAIFISDGGDLDQQLQGRVAGIQIRGNNSFNDNLKEVKMPTIEFKKIKVTANVNVKFILK
ncbi:MAG: SIMPL domain-containing protein, partial [Ferruginibacter sp.]